MKAIGHNLYLSALPTSPPTIPTVSVLLPPFESYTSLIPLPEHHVFIGLADTPDAALLPELDRALRFIHRHCQQPPGVLIHCFHGTSRCVAVALAYILLMRETQSAAYLLPPDRQVELELMLLRQSYPDAHPSPTFLRQLAAVAQRSPTNPALYTFPPVDGTVLPLEAEELLRLIASHGASSNNHLLRDAGADAPCAAACARCNEPLLPDGACLTALPQSNGCISVLPVRWMARCMLNSKGRLHCACGARVGSYDLRAELATIFIRREALRWRVAPPPPL